MFNGEFNVFKKNKKEGEAKFTYIGIFCFFYEMSYYGLFECENLFSTFAEYKKKKHLILEDFKTWGKRKKIIYNMYIFSRPLLDEKQQNTVWKEISDDFNYTGKDLHLLKLIDKKYLFSTYNEYRLKKLIIMKAYVKWNYQQIVIYRMYVYSKSFLKEKQKEIIWEEINNYCYMINNKEEICIN